MVTDTLIAPKVLKCSVELMKTELKNGDVLCHENSYRVFAANIYNP